MQRLIATALAPVLVVGQTAMQDMITAILAGLMAIAGCILLLAAACVAMVPLVGTAGALALTGLAFLILATWALVLRLVLRRRRLSLALPPRPDALVQLVFDLSFNIGRIMTRRRGQA
jgi:hypothetical protein